MPTSGGENRRASAEDLADTRTILAAERTLMSWIRTALAMISFGFTIFKFLQGLNAAGAIHLRRPHGPRNLGLFLSALGTGSLLAGLLEYRQTARQLSLSQNHHRATFYVACAVLALGIAVMATLVGQLGPF